jgi:hypothetical protein
MTPGDTLKSQVALVGQYQSHEMEDFGMAVWHFREKSFVSHVSYAFQNRGSIICWYYRKDLQRSLVAFAKQPLLCNPLVFVAIASLSLFV